MHARMEAPQAPEHLFSKNCVYVKAWYAPDFSDKVIFISFFIDFKHLQPTVNRQPWFPREGTCKDGPPARRWVLVLFREPVRVRMKPWHPDSAVNTQRNIENYWKSMKTFYE